MGTALRGDVGLGAFAMRRGRRSRGRVGRWCSVVRNSTGAGERRMVRPRWSLWQIPASSSATIFSRAVNSSTAANPSTNGGSRSEWYAGRADMGGTGRRSLGLEGCARAGCCQAQSNSQQRPRAYDLRIDLDHDQLPERHHRYRDVLRNPLCTTTRQASRTSGSPVTRRRGWRAHGEELAALFSVGRSTVYRAIEHSQ